MSDANKEVIYVDIDDEITGIIDKVRESDKKIVALVLPKRATALQSIVNMKLLKRISDDANKNLVLITSEAGLLPIAGAVGLYVAKTLNSKPAIPKPPKINNSAVTVDGDDMEEPEPSLDPNVPIGVLAGSMAAQDDEDTLEVDNTEDAAPVKATAPKDKKSRKLKVPNFERFRLLLVFGVLLLVFLIAGIVYAAVYMPKAKITIKTEVSKIATSKVMTVSTAQKQLDIANTLVPAVSKSINKTDSEKVPATGQKDNGTKATGSVSLKNCTKADGSVPVAAGTGVSSSNLTFITQEAVTLPASTFSGGGTCTTTAVDVDVTAQNAGDKYNLSEGRTYTVAGYSSIQAVGKAMSGGTSMIIKVVSENDIASAKQKLADRANNKATSELQDLFKADDLVGLNDTIIAETPVISSTPNVGDEASEVTVKSTVKYTMLGVQEEYVRQIIVANVSKSIDPKKQVIIDDGVNKATYSLKDKKSNTEFLITLTAESIAGPDLNEAAIKKEIAGKKRGETQSIIQSRPGIKDVTVEFSPFWVSKTPSNTNKTVIIFQQSSDGSK